MPEEKWWGGHAPVGKRPNIRRELVRIRRDPLDPLIRVLMGDEPDILSTDASRYSEAYYFYYLAMRRFLENMSITTRYDRGPKWATRLGGKRKFTKKEVTLADVYRNVRPYLEFDLINCLIHARILLDRVAGLTRAFWTSSPQPSFTSFNDHKKFFSKAIRIPLELEDYADYIRDRTVWFEDPLKDVRDKFVVHAAPKHMRFMGLPNDWELHLTIMTPAGSHPDRPLERVHAIHVSPLRMSMEIQEFLEWYRDYALAKVQHAQQCDRDGR